MRKIKEWLKKLWCTHDKQSFVRNIYGDEINHVSLNRVYRSWWECDECGKRIPHEKLISKEQEEEMKWRKDNWNKSVNQ